METMLVNRWTAHYTLHDSAQSIIPSAQPAVIPLTQLETKSWKHFCLKWQSEYNNLINGSKLPKNRYGLLQWINSWINVLQESWQKSPSIQITAKISLLSQRFHLTPCPHTTAMPWNRGALISDLVSLHAAQYQINQNSLEPLNCTYL